MFPRPLASYLPIGRRKATETFVKSFVPSAGAAEVQPRQVASGNAQWDESTYLGSSPSTAKTLIKTFVPKANTQNFHSPYILIGGTRLQAARLKR